MSLIKNTNLLSQDNSARPYAQMLKLDVTDSTNNYAMRLIDADKAEHGLTIVAAEQTAGKGQRGKTWSGVPGESLLMSLIMSPGYALSEQPLFLAAIATAVVNTLQLLVSEAEVTIKWPNDILIGDKKAAGILIENVVRGNSWQWAVAGIGLNVAQASFPDSLPNATSLRIITGRRFDRGDLAAQLRQRILDQPDTGADEVLAGYNRLLYRRGKLQAFSKDGDHWQATIQGINSQGQLLTILPDGTAQQYTHGTVEWIWTS